MRIRLMFVVAIQLLLAVTLLLAACDDGGSSSGTTSHHSAPTATFTPTSTPDPAAAVTLNRTAGATVSGLDLSLFGETDSSAVQIYDKLGIACEPGLAFTAPDPATANYSAADVQAIRNYVTSVPVTQDAFPIPDSQPPASMRWLAIGGRCSARLDVHNGGSQQVTIASVGLQLVAPPVPNTYHFAQVEVCSISPRFMPCGFNGQGPDAGYFAYVAIGPGSSGAAFPGNVDTDDPSFALPMLLLPGQTKSISLRIALADGQAPDGIYRVVPQLTVTDTTTHTVTFTSLTQTLAFADRSQISCYGLSGNAVVPSSQITYNSDYHAIC